MQRVLMILSVMILIGAIIFAAVGLDDGRGFPWGTHMVTVSAVLLLGVVIGWWLRERQLAEENARREIEEGK